MDIAAKGLDFQALNRQVKAASGDVCIRDCCGQRFIGSGLKDKTVTIHGTPATPWAPIWTARLSRCTATCRTRWAIP